MGTHFFNRHTTWTVFFSLLIALGLGACSDVSNAPAPPVPLSPDAKLSSLTVSPGTLAPTFSSDVANYTVDVAFNVTSVTVTASPQNAGSTMTVNGEPTTSGQSQTVTLGEVGSSTPIPIVVTAPNKSQNTYIVTVHRAVNTSLQSLTVSPGTLNPVFAASTTSYSVDVANTVTSITINATLQDATATMLVNGQATTSGQDSSILLGGPGSSTLVTIVIQQGSSQTTYFMTVNLAAPGGNNNLSGLTVSAGALVPTFAAATTTYAVAAPNATVTTTITATVADSSATLTINGVGAISGAPSASISLAVGQNSIPIVVTAPNNTQKTYIVNVTRAAPGGNNNLSGLTVSAGALVPTFAAATITYDVAAPNATASTTITATLADSTASLAINGASAISGSPSASISLAVGANVIPVVVTAQDGTPKTYTVTVTRAALEGNNNLSALVVSAGALIPTFAAATITYDVAASNATVTTTITATVADSTATLTVNGASAISGSPSASISLAVGANAIPVVVTAQNGTPKTYTVTVTRAALEGNNNLSALVVSAGALVPTFAAATITYDVAAPNTTASTTITATLEDSTASLTINGASAISGSPSASIPLAAGANAIPVVVTAQNGTLKTYTVTITVAS